MVVKFEVFGSSNEFLYGGRARPGRYIGFYPVETDKDRGDLLRIRCEPDDSCGRASIFLDPKRNMAQRLGNYILGRDTDPKERVSVLIPSNQEVTLIFGEVSVVARHSTG